MDAVRFDELNINDKILKAVKEMGFEAASPIQGAAIPVVLEGRDIVARDVLDEAVKAFKSTHAEVEVKEIQLYIVAEEGAAYYVVNGEASDDYKIML